MRSWGTKTPATFLFMNLAIGAEVSQAGSALVVTHKGVIRTIVENLCGEKIEATQPVLGGVIQVDDSLTALHALTRHVRAGLPEHLVAVTGSVGKTTTKDLLGLMLAERFTVARNPGNLNNPNWKKKRRRAPSRQKQSGTR